VWFFAFRSNTPSKEYQDEHELTFATLTDELPKT